MFDLFGRRACENLRIYKTKCSPIPNINTCVKTIINK
jgi:hypothetical protein